MASPTPVRSTGRRRFGVQSCSRLRPWPPSCCWLFAGLAWYATTPAFAAMVRQRLIATLEQATGGRVELESFRWRLLRLEFEADNLTIHGFEAPGEVPYAHIDRLFVRAKIISLFRAKIGLNLLEGTHPVFHLIVSSDGSTNQPRPKTESHHGSITDTLFDLAVDRTEITNGVLLLNQRAIPFNVAANNLAAQIEYDRARDHYLANLQAEDVTAQRASFAPVHSRLQVKTDFSRTGVNLLQLQLQTGNSARSGSLLEASGSLQDFANPQVQLAATGTIDVRQVEALTDIPGLERGIVDLQVGAKGRISNFVLDGHAKVTGAAYRLPEVQLSGVDATTNLHITQDEIALSGLKGRFAEGGSFDGEFRLADWLAPTAAAPEPPAGGHGDRQEIAESSRRAGGGGGDRQHSRPDPGYHAAQRDENGRPAKVSRPRLRYSSHRRRQRAVDGQREEHQGHRQPSSPASQSAGRNPRKWRRRRHVRQSPRSGRHSPVHGPHPGE